MGPIITIHGVAVSVAGLAVLGISVGYVAGMFGIGGGFIITPLLVVIFKIPLPIAVGTGLCQVIGTALVAFLRHRQVKQGEPRIDLAMLPGSLLGVGLGTRLLHALKVAGMVSLAGRPVPLVNLVVELGYAAMLLGVALTYWRHSSARVDVLRYLRPGPLARLRLGPGIALPAVGLSSVSATLVAYLGLGLGLLSGLLGIGGGVALNPVLLYGFGFPIRQVVGTGILVVLATAIVGTALQALVGNVHLGLAVILLIGGTASAQVGALMSRRLSGRTLGRLQALLVLAAMAAVLWDLSSYVR